MELNYTLAEQKLEGRTHEKRGRAGMGMAYSVGAGGSGTYQVHLLEEIRFDEEGGPS